MLNLRIAGNFLSGYYLADPTQFSRQHGKLVEAAATGLSRAVGAGLGGPPGIETQHLAATRRRLCRCGGSASSWTRAAKCHRRSGATRLSRPAGSRCLW